MLLDSQSMKTSSILLLAMTVSLEGVRYRSDYRYVPDVGGWLKLHRVPASWREARLRCHLEGGTLASPLNSQLSSALKTLMTADGVTCGLFTGIHATFSRGDFASVEGVPLSRIPARWAAGEPNNERDAEQCLLLLPDATLADVPCEDTFPYACYRKKTPGLLLNSCGTFDNGYTLDARTGSCYKFHTTPRTWSRAYMACAAEGGHLAVINSEAEAAALHALFAKFPGRLIPTRSFFGKTLEQAGYSTWHAGEPNNSTTGEFCGALFRSGGLDDLWCEGLYSFICEKTPDSLLWDDEDEQ